MTTLYENLLAANLPVVSVDEELKTITMGYMTWEQAQTYLDIVMQYFSPVEWDDLVQHRADTQQLRDEYVSTITQLETIENTASPTNAQVIAAVKYLAKTIRLLLKLLARQYR